MKTKTGVLLLTLIAWAANGQSPPVIWTLPQQTVQPVQGLDTTLMPHPESPSARAQALAAATLLQQQAHQIQLQNEQLQLQIDQQKKATAVPAVLPQTAPPRTTDSQTDTSSENIRSHGLLNGRWWRVLDQDRKLIFLLGIMDAIRLDPQPGSGLLVSPGTLEETAEAVDLFFADSSNRPVPIIESLMVVKMRAIGDDPDKVDQVAASLRRRAVGLPPAK